MHTRFLMVTSKDIKSAKPQVKAVFIGHAVRSCYNVSLWDQSPEIFKQTKQSSDIFQEKMIFFFYFQIKKRDALAPTCFAMQTI